MMKFAIVAFVALCVACTVLAVSSSASGPTSKPSATQQATTMPSEADVLAVTKTHCLRCHPAITSVDIMIKKGWIKPGDAEHSPLYITLGKTKKSGNYHDVSAQEKAVIHDFIQGIKTPASGPASQPAKGKQ